MTAHTFAQRAMRALWPKRPLLRWMAALGMVLALAIAGVAAFVWSPAGRDALFPRIAAALAPEGGAVRYSKLSGDWPREVVVENVMVSDADGVWLTIDRLTLEWSPLRLLQRAADVSRLSIVHPVIVRMPLSAENDKAVERESLDLPVDIHVAALEIEQGVMHAPVAAGFAARGKLDVEKGRLIARIAAEREDGPEEFIRLDGAFDANERVLRLKAEAKGAPRGLLATLIGMPELPGVTLSAKGEGPAEDWRLAIDGAVETYGAVALTGKLAWREDVALDLAGRFEGGAALPATLRQLTAGGIALDAHWRRTEGTDDLKVAAGGDAVDANVDVRLGAPTLLKAQVLTGAASVQTKQMFIIDGTTRFAALKAAATLSGSVTSPDVATTFEVAGLSAREVSARDLKGILSLETRAGAADTRYRVSGNGNLSDVVADGRTLFDTALWSLDVMRQGPQSELTDLSLDATGLKLKASGALDETTGVGRASGVLDAVDLAALTPFAGEDLAGQGHLKIEAARESKDAPWRIETSGTTQDLAVAGTVFAPYTGPTLSFAGRGAVSEAGAVTIDEATLDGDKLAVKAKGALLPRLDATLSANGDLVLLGAAAGIDAKGPLEATIKAQGTLDAPRLAATAKSARAWIAGRDLGRVSVSLVPQGAGGFANSLASFDADGPLGRTQIRAPVKQADRAWSIGPIDGNAYGAALSGTVRSGGEGLTGALKAQIADLGVFMPVVTGTRDDADGSVTADIQFAGTQGTSATLTGRGIALSAPHFSARRLSVTADLGDVYNVRAEARGGELPGVRSDTYYDRLILTAQGPLDAIAVALESQGLTGEGGTLSVHGVLNAARGDRTFDVDTLTGKLWGTDIALDKPARLNVGPSGTRLSDTDLRVGAAGRIVTRYSSDGKGQRGGLDLQALPIPFVGRVADADWPQGTIDGAASFDTTLARAGGSVKLALKDAIFAPGMKTRMAPLNGALKGVWNGRVLTIDSAFSRDTTVPIVIAGRLPLESRGARGFALNPKGALAGNVKWEGRVGTLWSFLPLDLYRVDGDGRLAITAAGTWGKPRIEGRFDLSGGTFDGLSTGTRLTGLTAALDANTTSAKFTLSGRDSASGRLTSEGRIEFDTTRGFPLDGTMDFKGLRVIGLDELSAVASGRAALSGTLNAMLLKGDLTFDRVDAVIPDKLPPSVPTLPVTYVDRGAAITTGMDAPAKDEGEGLTLDIKVRVPARATLSGRGLTSEWKGDLAVTGSHSAPVVVGEAKLQRGTLAFAGRSFPLTRGTVSFDGGEKVDPRLDIAAVRTVNAVAITLAVTGRSSAPKIEISSEPKVPQDEAMALLLLGKPAGSLTPLELLDVARAVATLSGTSLGGGGLDVVDRARRTLGLDVLTLDTSTGSGDDAKNITNSASVSAGRYVTDKVYVGVKQGVQTGSGAVELEIELTPNISATTEVGQQSGGSAGLNWKWDY